MIKKKVLLIIVIPLIVIVWSLYFLNKDIFQFENLLSNIDKVNFFIKSNLLLSVILFIFFYFLLIICNFPSASLLTLIGGFLFGTWIGGLSVIIGGTLGAYLVFLASKFFFLDFINKKILYKYPYIKNYFYKNDIELMLLIRLIPITPFFVQNLILAGLGPKNFKFFITTLIGLSPWAFIYASLGQGLDQLFLNNQEFNLSFVANPEYLIPIGLMSFLIILIILFKKKFKR